MLIPFRCPICEGRGTVPHGFYDRTEGASSTEPEPGRKCEGTGTINVYANDPFPPFFVTTTYQHPLGGVQQ